MGDTGFVRAAVSPIPPPNQQQQQPAILQTARPIDIQNSTAVVVGTFAPHDDDDENNCRNNEIMNINNNNVSLGEVPTRIKATHPVSSSWRPQQQPTLPTPGQPQHVAFVCDGNSRWARARGVPSLVGHAVGANRLVQLVQTLRDDPSIRYCTVFGFSTENWRRSAREIADIWNVMEQTLERCADHLFVRPSAEHAGIVLRVLGDLDDPQIPESLRIRLRQLEQETWQQQQQSTPARQPLTLCIAINYGGRADLVAATRRIAQRVSRGELDADNVTEATVAAHLDTHGIPDPDLIVRTSGETRLSNFLLWNAAYAELYFTEELWPDFDGASLQKAMDWFAQRRRRYGGRQNNECDNESGNARVT